MRAKFRCVLALTVVGLGAIALTSCADSNQSTIGGDVIAPITMELSDLAGENIELLVGQTLNIRTEPEPVDKVTGEVADATVAEFVAGRVEQSAEFNPAITGVQPGDTRAVLFTSGVSDDPIEFTITVLE